MSESNLAAQCADMAGFLPNSDPKAYIGTNHDFQQAWASFRACYKEYKHMGSCNAIVDVMQHYEAFRIAQQAPEQGFINWRLGWNDSVVELYKAEFKHHGSRNSWWLAKTWALAMLRRRAQQAMGHYPAQPPASQPTDRYAKAWASLKKYCNLRSSDREAADYTR